MTNQEWLQQNNAKIEAIQEKLAHKVIAKGTIEITENGKYDVAGYGDANVNVPVPDLSATTATADDVLQGKKFYNAEGELVEGGYVDMLQRYVNWRKWCNNIFEACPDEDMSWTKNLDTSQSTNLYYMFANCPNVKTLDISGYNTSNVTKMESVFSQSQQLESVDVTGIDTSKVTTMARCFYNCTALTNIIGLNTWNTSNVTSMTYMFNRVKTTELDLSSFNTSNVTNMSYMFSYSTALTQVDMSNFDTSNTTNFQDMFKSCSKLKTIVGTLDLINATAISGIIYDCMVLEDVIIKNIKLSTSFGWCYALSNNTLINTIQQLWDNTDNALGGSRTLTLTTDSKNNIANVYVKLIPVTDEMRAEDEYIDNKKPCVVCDASDEGAMTLTEYAISKNWAIA